MAIRSATIGIGASDGNQIGRLRFLELDDHVAGFKYGSGILDHVCAGAAVVIVRNG